MNVLFPAPLPVFAHTSNGQAMPIRRVFCIGRNYAAHAREMGRDPDREPPFFFTKWAETVVNADAGDHATIAYPPQTRSFHFEMELVVAIGKTLFDGDRHASEDAIWGYAAGLDMTRRDLQLEARQSGRPWDTGKNVEQSSPIGRLVEKQDALRGGFDAAASAISLRVNGEEKQAAHLSELLWPVPECVAYISRFYQLEPGDLIFTGTPQGVGAVVPGDVLAGEITGLPPVSVRVADPRASTGAARGIDG